MEVVCEVHTTADGHVQSVHRSLLESLPLILRHWGALMSRRAWWLDGSDSLIGGFVSLVLRVMGDYWREQPWRFSFSFFFPSKWRAWHGVIGRGVGRVVAAPAQRNGVQRGWMPNVQGGVLRFALLIFLKWEVVALSPIDALLDFWQDFFFFCGFPDFSASGWFNQTPLAHRWLSMGLLSTPSSWKWRNLIGFWRKAVKKKATLFFGERVRVLFQVDTKRLLPFTASNKNIQNRLRARNHFLIAMKESRNAQSLNIYSFSFQKNLHIMLPAWRAQIKFATQQVVRAAAAGWRRPKSRHKVK